MSLSALKNVDPDTARGALASTVVSITGPGLGFVPEKFSAISQALVKEARRALGLAEDDQTSKALHAIREFLSKEVDRQLYAGIDRKALQEDLGRSGELSIGAYAIRFDHDFDDGHRENRKFVENTIRSADEIEHRSLGLVREAGADRGLSLFSKVVASTDRRRTNVLLIEAVRTADVLHVARVWRLFPEVIDLTKPSTPFELLQAFVEHYGFDVEYDGLARGKIIHDFRLPSHVNDADLRQRMKKIHSRGRPYIATELGADVVAISEEGVEHPISTIILHFYVIDVGKYRSDYARFG